MARLRLFGCLLLLAAITACARSGDGDGQREGLYVDCSSEEDCAGSGLLCDERRGCVECLNEEDCPSSDVCRVGVCEPAESSDESQAEDDEGASAESAADSEADTESDESGSPGDESESEGDDESDSPTDGQSGDDTGGAEAGQADEEQGASSDPGNDGQASGDDAADDDDTTTDVTSDAGSAAGDDSEADGSQDDGPRCGDGILRTSEEACDDGNLAPGDGCSETCTVEDGADCEARATDCETIAGQCVVRLPATFRDFPGSHPDFNTLYADCSTLEGAPGMVQALLGPDGKPVFGDPPLAACVTSAATFAEWYADGAHAQTVAGEVVLFQDGATFSNRHGHNGERWAVSDPSVELGGYGSSPETCAETCEFRSVLELDCENICRPDHDAVLALQNELDEAAADPDVSDAELSALQAEIAEAQATADACASDCDADFRLIVEACAAACLPCSYGGDQWCVGQWMEFEGTPLFFPVDHVDGPTTDLSEATIPEAYGHPGYPYEGDVTGEHTLHNFSFTTELRVEFVYTESMSALVEVLGDDDIWLFINGTLAIDLGGLHPPLGGSVAIDASTAGAYGLVDGTTYELAIFHAERQLEGSSFRLSLRGFNLDTSAQTSVCTAE